MNMKKKTIPTALALAFAIPWAGACGRSESAASKDMQAASKDIQAASKDVQKDIKATVDDAGIKVAVKAKLAEDVRFSTLTSIEVNSTNGIVTLSGQVSNEADRAAAAELTKSVSGVVSVNNELQVKKPAQ